MNKVLINLVLEKNGKLFKIYILKLKMCIIINMNYYFYCVIGLIVENRKKVQVNIIILIL